MAQQHGRFVWYELMTTDPAAARAFYTHVAGWGTQDTQIAGPNYTMFTVGQNPVAGMMELPEDARARGIPPFWIGYVGVDDVDASAARATELGGTVHVPPSDIPNVGRFSVILDPQGASISLFKTPSTEACEMPGQMTPGHVGWHELMAADWEKVFPFYAEMFGWQKREAIQMGPGGVYQLYGTSEQDYGGMATKPPALPRPFWLYYVNVTDIDAAVTRVKDHGGEVLNGPMEVPGGMWIIHGRDPQGAMFALVGRRG